MWYLYKVARLLMKSDVIEQEKTQTHKNTRSHSMVFCWHLMVTPIVTKSKKAHFVIVIWLSRPDAL